MAVAEEAARPPAADAEQGLDSRGPITYVQGKDNSNVVRPLIEKWNAAHPNEKVTFKEQTDQADQQHDDLVQNFQAKNANYDVVSVDVVWTAEFAAKGWLQPLKDKMALDTSAMLKPTVEAASYKGTLYAAPQNSDGGILYYRKDLVPTAPKTWDEMMGMCSIAEGRTTSAASPASTPSTRASPSTPPRPSTPPADPCSTRTASRA